MDEPLSSPLSVSTREDIDALETEVTDAGVVGDAFVLTGVVLVPEGLDKGRTQSFRTDHIAGQTLRHIDFTIVAESQVEHHLVDTRSLHLCHDVVERLLI